jgi:Tfp pilus assembly protein PilZ
MRLKEHRKTYRKRCLVPIEGKENSAYGDIHSIDISRDGLGVISKHRISLNQTVAVEVELKEGQEPVFVLGQVKWIQAIGTSGNYRIGMKFIKVLSSGARSRLAKYLGGMGD